jgi:predicted transport protein
MPLFQIKGHDVVRILPQEKRNKEDVIHHLIEENLSNFFADLLFVAHKPRIGGKEFDTLALNKATKAPVILEYKREKDRNVIEQIDLYYVKLSNHKADVLMLLKNQDVIELNEVDFENPEIIVVAQEFSREQREILSLKFRNFLRLFRYQLYDKHLITLEQVEPLGYSVHGKLNAGGDQGANDGLYSLETFGMKPDTKKLYDKLDREIMSLDSRIKPGRITKYLIGYGATGGYFCTIQPRKRFLRVKVKCLKSPKKVQAFEIQKLTDQTMSHVFNLSSVPQIGPALRIIKLALEDSL